MQIKNRLFPYPILNNEQFLSSYKNGEFELVYEISEDDDYYILKDVRFKTNSDTLVDLYLNEYIDVVCIVECSYTIYRKCYRISQKLGNDIKLSKKEFNGKVFVSSYAYALKDFELKSNEFEEDYNNITFEIEKYDIVAANDGFYVSFYHDEKEDDMAKSIFEISIDNHLQDGLIGVDYTSSKKIIISLSKTDYNNYKFIFKSQYYKEVFFSMMIVPTLVEAFSKCLYEVNSNPQIEEIEDLTSDFAWFRAVIEGYKKRTGESLTKDIFGSKPAIYWAQFSIGNPISKALSNLVEREDNINKGGEDDE